MYETADLAGWLAGVEWCGVVVCCSFLLVEMEKIVLKLFVAVALDTPKYQHFFVEVKKNNPIHNKTRKRKGKSFLVFFFSSDPKDCVDE